ncbi:MAG TPA: hypothetical protein VKU39_11940 [Streptosporangiaceae bacterium]|nr:hypothetical protein [Streptosporangiaceae bacterium]
MREDWEDERLLDALRESQRARQDVPPWFTQAGQGAYAWHDIAAQLARLTYDSDHDQELEGVMRSAGMRSEAASIRALTFTSARLSIELEVTADSLVGQIIPPRQGTVEQQAMSGETAIVPIDEIGCFYLQPVPTGSFRLRCKTGDGVDVVTNWFVV